MNYFSKQQSIEEIKKEYRNIVKKYHPDNGGDLETMKEINKQFDELIKKKNKDTNQDELDKFKEIINELINFDVVIEIIGSWVWISGNTYPYRETLNKLDFKWSNKKKMWHWHQGEYKRWSKREMTIEEIRLLHGSKVVNNSKLITV